MDLIFTRPNVELLEITDLQENRRLSAEPGLKKRLPHYVCADFFSFLNLPTASIFNKIIIVSNYSETRHSLYYLITKFTILPLTTITLTISLPSVNFL